MSLPVTHEVNATTGLVTLRSASGGTSVKDAFVELPHDGEGVLRPPTAPANVADFLAKAT
jgi:hypothetical protein